MLIWSRPIGTCSNNPNKSHEIAHGRHIYGIGTRLDLTSVVYEDSSPVDVLNSEDLLVGTIIAFALASVVSFLQSRRSRNDFLLFENLPAESLLDANVTENRVFNADAWKEISRPDNYVFYNRKVKVSQKAKDGTNISPVEKTWVLVALLALFVPIFSVEFFFAVSRQLICDQGNSILQPDWAEYLCSPV